MTLVPDADDIPEVPLPYDPDELIAARDIPGPSEGEYRHREMQAAGEESQEHGSDDPA